MADLPTAREAMQHAVEAADAGNYNRVRAWVMIAHELREGSRQPAEDDQWDPPATLDQTERIVVDAGLRVGGYVYGDRPITDVEIGAIGLVGAANRRREAAGMTGAVGAYQSVPCVLGKGPAPVDDCPCVNCSLARPEAVDVTQQFHGDTFCRNCTGILIWHTGRAGAGPDDVEDLWLHRSNYQTLCPVPNNDSGERMFADPVSDQ